ncbi:MAG: restriction endonuclease subunit S [Butyrivibrio sp.]|jgi:type I restriction enzyme S subunit|nr:restriction endonuclease subunit S [Butyrivibrio sp.]
MEIELKKLGEITTGNTPSKKDEKYWDSADICFVKPDRIADEGITLINDSSEYISENARGKARVVSKDAVFVTCIGSIGKVGIADYGDYAFNQQINVIEPNEKVLPRYLAYNLLYSKPRLVAIANAPVVPIINKTQFGEFIVNIEEDTTKQAEIITVLDKLAGIIDSRKKELEAFDELIKARFVEMFGDPFINNCNWAKLKIAQAVTVEPQNGMYKPQSDYVTDDTGIPILRIDGFYDGKVTNWTTLKRLNCSNNDLEKYLLVDDDIVINRVNSIEYLGKCAHITGMIEPTVYESNMMRMHFDAARFNPIYITRLLCTQYVYDQIVNHAKKAVNQASINQKDVLDFDVYQPPKELQDQFADFVKQVDKSKVVLQKALDETQLLFDSLMQKYFG